MDILRTLLPTLAVFGTGGILLADTANGTTPDNTRTMIEMVLNSLGPLAILGWYLWYDKSKSQPRRDKEQREERENAAKLNEDRVDKLVKAQGELSVAFSTALAKQADSFASTSNRMADVHERMIENCSKNRNCKAE